MKKITFILLVFLCLNGFFFFSNAQSSQSSLEGSWIIDSVWVKTIINGSPSIKTYRADDNIKLFVSCPQKIRFSLDEAEFEYKDTSVKSGIYKVTGTYRKSKDGLLRVWFNTGLIEYQCSMKDDNSVCINYVADYIINGVDGARDEYKYYGHKE